MRHFSVHGPFEIMRNKHSMIKSDSVSKKEFWRRVEDSIPGLPDACGCYIFCLRAALGFKPWYVGKAEKQTFAKECFTPDKIVKFNIVSVGRKGTPILYLLSAVTPKGKFRKPTIGQRPAIVALENILVGMALSRNQELLNIKGASMWKDIEVEGLLNSKVKKGKPAVQDLRKILRGK